MPKSKDTVIDKKTKEKLTEEILNEINSTVKEDLVREVSNEVRNEFTYEHKEKIKEEVTEEIISDIKNSIKKDQNRITRKKNFRLFRYTIYIILLLTATIYLIVRLYQTSNLDIIHKGLDKKVSEVVKTPVNTTETTTSLVKDLEYYKTNYSYLIDNIKITNVNLVKGKYNIKDVDLKDRLVMAFNALSDEDVVVDGSIYSVEESKLISSYENLFGTSEDYLSSEFSVGSLNFVYSSNNQKYMAIGNLSIDEYVVNNMIEANEYENGISIICNVALVKGESIYNVNNRYYKLGEVKDGLVDFAVIPSNKLTTVEYKFESNNGTYKLVSIEKK